MSKNKDISDDFLQWNYRSVYRTELNLHVELFDYFSVRSNQTSEYRTFRWWRWSICFSSIEPNFLKKTLKLSKNSKSLAKSNWFDQVRFDLIRSDIHCKVILRQIFPIQFKFNIGCYFLFLVSIWLQTKVFSN